MHRKEGRSGQKGLGVEKEGEGAISGRYAADLIMGYARHRSGNERGIKLG